MATSTTESRRLTSKNIEGIIKILAEKGGLPIEDAFGCVYDLLPKNLQSNHSGARVSRAVEEQKYDELSVPQLKDVCRRSGIKGFSKLKKDDLLDLLTNAGDIEQEDFVSILIDNFKGSGLQSYLDDEGKLTGRFEASEGMQLNMSQLKQIARGSNLKGYGNLKKADLIALLRGDADSDESDAEVEEEDEVEEDADAEVEEDADAEVEDADAEVEEDADAEVEDADAEVEEEDVETDEEDEVEMKKSK